MGMVLLFIAFLNYIVFLWEENMNHIYKSSEEQLCRRFRNCGHSEKKREGESL